MNIVVLMAGSHASSAQDSYPFYLTEIHGQIILERQVESLLSLQPSRVIFCVRAADIQKYKIDGVVQQCSDVSFCVPIEGDTAGSICTALLAGEWIDSDAELLLVAADDFVEEDTPATETVKEVAKAVANIAKPRIVESSPKSKSIFLFIRPSICLTIAQAPPSSIRDSPDNLHEITGDLLAVPCTFTVV